jgi:hypothetical protein
MVITMIVTVVKEFFGSNVVIIAPFLINCSCICWLIKEYREDTAQSLWANLLINRVYISSL